MQGEKNSRKSKQGNKCRKNNNRFKQLKFKKEKGRKKRKKKTPHNCKNPTLRQRFITIKKVTEKKNKVSSKV